MPPDTRMYVRLPEAETFEELTRRLEDHRGVTLVAFRGPSGKWRGSSQIELLNPNPEAFRVDSAR